MPGELGPIEIVCEAPPYSVVKACAGLGFRSPADVRWRRISRQTVKKSNGLFSWLRPSKLPCSCGQPMPDLEQFTFTYTSGKQERYHVGQCGRCLTIYWDEG